MDKYFTARGATMGLIVRYQHETIELLLQKRMNTGFMDNHWDFAAAGHIEAHESATMCMRREFMEEIGIDVLEKNMKFVHLTHLYDPDHDNTYFNCYFWIDTFSGTPQIKEPHKIAELEWFKINELPESMIPSRYDVLQAILTNTCYSEQGFHI